MRRLELFQKAKSYLWKGINLHSSSHSSPWKVISHILLFFLSHTNLSLGCGTKIRFSLDPRVDLLSLSSRFPRLFNLSSLKSGVGSSFLSSSSDWNFHFPWNMRDREIVELSFLLVLLQNTHLSPTCPDSRLWSFTSSVFFSVSFPPSLLFQFPLPLSRSPSKWFGSLISLLKSRLFFEDLLGAGRVDISQSFNPNLTLLPKFVLFVSLLQKLLIICLSIAPSFRAFGCVSFRWSILSLFLLRKRLISFVIGDRYLLSRFLGSYGFLVFMHMAYMEGKEPAGFWEYCRGSFFSLGVFLIFCSELV